MASRTKTKNREAVAVELGVSLRTVERWARAGTMDANVERRRVGKVRHRIVEEERASDFRHPAPPANDNAEQPPSLTETGYTGRHLTLNAGWVQDVVTRFPALAADIRAHLDGIDMKMRKTPECYKKRVFLNLIRDCNQSACRALRKAA